MGGGASMYRLATLQHPAQCTAVATEGGNRDLIIHLCSFVIPVLDQTCVHVGTCPVELVVGVRLGRFWQSWHAVLLVNLLVKARVNTSSIREAEQKNKGFLQKSIV